MSIPRIPPKGQNKGPLPAERIASSFKQLAVSSADLNSAVGELSVNISALDAALAKLKLEVSAWHQIAGHEDRDGSYWTREIGYSRVGKQWGIALKRTSGLEYADETHDEEIWFFSDAPRWMQIESVGKIPDLFDELIKRTDDTLKKIRSKTIEARDLATAINEAISALSPQQ